MSSTPRPSYAERERERLRRFELKRSRSRSKVPGRGRGRPRLSDAELTKRCQQAQHVRRARKARQEQQRQAALPHSDAAWQARYQAAHALAANGGRSIHHGSCTPLRGATSTAPCRVSSRGVCLEICVCPRQSLRRSWRA